MTGHLETTKELRAEGAIEIDNHALLMKVLALMTRLGLEVHVDAQRQGKYRNLEADSTTWVVSTKIY